MDPSHPEFFVNVIGVLMISVAAIAIFYPWRPEQPFASKLVHLPLVFIPLWIAYEVVMPDYMNIRVDLFVIPLLLLFLIVIWAVKVARFRNLKHKDAEQVSGGNGG
jgi:hypothetical protein